MYHRNLLIARWVFFSGVALLIIFLQLLLAQGFHTLPATPFLLPMLVAVTASYEQEAAGFFALAVGAFADSLLLSPLPFCYTLSFPLAALLCALLSRQVIAPGFLRSLSLSLLTFLLCDGLMMLYLSSQGASFPLLLGIELWQLLFSLPFLLLIHPLCRAIYRRCLLD